MSTKHDRGRYSNFAGRYGRRQIPSSYPASFHLQPRHSSYGASTLATRLLILVSTFMMAFYIFGAIFNSDGRTPAINKISSLGSDQSQRIRSPGIGVHGAPLSNSANAQTNTDGVGAPVAKEALPVVSDADKKIVNTDTQKSDSDSSGTGDASQINVSNDEKQVSTTSTSTRRKRATAFMVVFLGHSGSTAFITEMRGHPEFEIEELEPVDHFEYEHNTELAIKYIREILDRAVAKGKVAGFKIRPYHIRHNTQAWQDLAKEYDIRVFWNFRENVVKQAIGEYRHRVLNDTSVVEGLKQADKVCDEKSGYKCQFPVENVKAVHDLMNEFSVNDEYLAEAVRLLKRDDHMMVIKYEDYLYRRERLMREVMDFLGVDYQETQSLRAKASLDSLCDMVTNYQELCAMFYPCQLWRPFLDDERNDCYCKGSNSLQFDPKLCVRMVWHQNPAA